MSLSEQELRTLREIERSLMAEDPHFGENVGVASSLPGGGGRLTLRGVALVLLGLLMMLGGVALAQQSLWFIALSVAGFLVMFAAGVWMLRATNGSVQGVAPSAARPRRKSSGSGMGSKLEENFKRRFEGQ